MKKYFLIIITSLIISVVPGVIADSNTTFSESKWGNQTITNVFVNVDLEELSSHTLNGSVMTSSGIIIGFVGFASVISVSSLVRDIKERQQLLAIIGVYCAVTIIIISHLIIILHAFSEILTVENYAIVIVTTIVLVISMVVLTALLTYFRSTYDDRLHERRLKAEAAKREYRKRKGSPI